MDQLIIFGVTYSIADFEPDKSYRLFLRTEMTDDRGGLYWEESPINVNTQQGTVIYNFSMEDSWVITSYDQTDIEYPYRIWVRLVEWWLGGDQLVESEPITYY